MSRRNRKKLAEFFQEYDKPVQNVIKQVLELEQQHIDSKRPRVKDDIRDLIEREVNKK